MEKLTADSPCPTCGGKLIVVSEDDVAIELGCPECEEIIGEFK
jgi:uncharacterized protein YbaR (Trm112 family)